MPKTKFVNYCNGTLPAGSGNLCKSFFKFIEGIRDKTFLQNKENFDIAYIDVKKTIKISKQIYITPTESPYFGSKLGGHAAITQRYGDNFTWVSTLTSQNDFRKIHNLGISSYHIADIGYKKLLKELSVNCPDEIMQTTIDSVISALEIKVGQGISMPQLISNDFIVSKSVFVEEIRRYFLLKQINLSGYGSDPDMCNIALQCHQIYFEKLKLLEEKHNVGEGSSLILDEILAKRDKFSSCSSVFDNFPKKN